MAICEDCNDNILEKNVYDFEVYGYKYELCRSCYYERLDNDEEIDN